MESIEQIYKILERKFKLYENGLVVQDMKKHGIIYKKSHGISTVQLKQFSLPYKNNHELALLLWSKNLREAKLLAFLVENSDIASQTQIDKWISEFNNGELVEQASINLLYKLPYANLLCKKHLKSNLTFAKMTAYLILANYLKHNQKLIDIKLDYIYETIINDLDNDNTFIKKSIARVLLEIAKIDDKTRISVNIVLEKIKSKDNNTAKWIHYEVSTLLKYT